MPPPRFNIDQRGLPVIEAHYRNYNLLYLPDLFHFFVNSAMLDHEGRLVVAQADNNANTSGDDGLEASHDSGSEAGE